MAGRLRSRRVQPLGTLPRTSGVGIRGLEARPSWTGLRVSGAGPSPLTEGAPVAGLGHRTQRAGAESQASWTGFLRSLVARSLTGVRLAISDAHLGVKAAVASTLEGAA